MSHDIRRVQSRYSLDGSKGCERARETTKVIQSFDISLMISTVYLLNSKVKIEIDVQ